MLLSGMVLESSPPVLIFPLPFTIFTFKIVVDAISALSGGVLVSE